MDPKPLIAACCLALSTAAVTGQNIDQMLKNAQNVANNVKKTTPPGDQPKNSGMPPGYDNSWQVSISYRVTQRINDHKVTKSTSCDNAAAPCTNTDDAHGEFSYEATLSSNKCVGFSSADQAQITSYASTGEDLRKFATPLQGSGNLKWDMRHSITGCCTPQHANYNGTGQIDPKLFEMTFQYDKQKKEGNLTIESAPFDAATNQVTAGGDVSGPLAQAVINDASRALGGSFYACAANNVGLATTGSLAATCAFLGDSKQKLSVSETKTGYEADFSATRTGTGDMGEISWTMNVHVSIARATPEKYEAVIEPLMDMASYNDWVPEGPPVKGPVNALTDKGNSIAFHVRILDKKTKQDVTDLHPFVVTYTLDNVSNYPGYCMNYPKRESADDKPDLRWDSLYYAKNEHLGSQTDKELVSKPKEGGMLAAMVTSYDYAAYGTLKAHVTIEDESLDLDATLKDTPGQYFVSIPKDDNKNKIADKWEKDVQMWGKNSDADFDEDEYPKKQKRNGDGYTMFEEYRGFAVKDNLLPSGSHETFTNGHLRMDPNYKDIFIWDKDGFFKQYYEPYNPSDLCWHYIDQDQFIFTESGKDPENRWMNFNEVAEHFYAKQYGLIMEDKPAENQGGTLGEQLDYNKIKQWGVPGDSYIMNDESESNFGYVQPVKNTIIVDVYTGDITRQSQYFKTDQQQGVYTILITGVINHEIGHALGITHHRTPAGVEDSTTTPSGVVNCSMRYLSKTETAHGYVVFRTPYYCHKDDTWQQPVQTPEDQLDPSKAVRVNTVTTPSNNCYGMIDVKSDP